MRLTNYFIKKKAVWGEMTRKGFSAEVKNS